MDINLKDLVVKLSETMSISGYEAKYYNAIHEIINPYFDEYQTDNAHNHIYVRKCGKENARKLLISTHFDEIGMIVTEIKDGGFLKVTAVGGIDTRIMPASEVIIYGKQTITGVVVSTPPHLQKPGENNKLPKVTDLLIDTGYPKEDIEKFVELGTPVGFKPLSDELLNGKLVGKGFDDKSCCAVAVKTVAELDMSEVDWDIYMVLSAKEETSLFGAKIAAFNVTPDAAIIMDVDFARTPDTSKVGTCVLGDGAAIAISTTTNRKMTKSMINFAKERELKLQQIVSITRTGTDNDAIAYGLYGIPSIVVSLPLKNMHTYSEILSLDDMEDFVKLLSEYIKGGLSSCF
jgi:Cellulase M and related proteins